MLHAHIRKEKAIPWWAVIGAPMVGVPLVVALLALVGPGEPVADQPQDVEFAVEQVELDPMSHSLDSQASRILTSLDLI
jgi:hypothetical protein